MRSKSYTPAVARALAAALVASSLVVAPVRAETGEPELQAAAQQGVRKFQKRQRRPVKLGTSGGNVNDFEIDLPFITCTSGTLGALMESVPDDPQEEPRYFILSNNHVLARTNKGRPGEGISQAGLIDLDSCEADEGDLVATLSGRKKIRFSGSNTVDMALAEVIDGTVKTNGKQLRIGVPGNDIVEAFVGQAVQKSGRTTGHTRGVVVDIDGFFLVSFSVGSDSVKEASYRRQIVIEGVNGSFSGGGDSGAVIFENVKRCPRAVGLLFAGNGELTAANPMSEVLEQAAKIRPRGEKRMTGCDNTAPEALTAAAGGAVAGASEARVFRREDREFRAARRVRDLSRDWVLELPGVVGYGVGFDDLENRNLVLRVYVERAAEEIRAGIPTEIDGVRTHVVETGKFVAY